MRGLYISHMRPALSNSGDIPEPEAPAGGMYWRTSMAQYQYAEVSQSLPQLTYPHLASTIAT